MVQSRSPRTLLDNARTPRHRRRRTTLLLVADRLLCHPQDRRRACSSRTTTCSPGWKSSTPSPIPLYQQRGPRKRGWFPGSMAARSSSAPCGKPPARTPTSPKPRLRREQGDHTQYRVRDLLWRPAGRLVRSSAVIHPTRGACLSHVHRHFPLDAIDIIRLYRLALQDRAHSSSRQCARSELFTYHFWMTNMKLRRRNSGNQHLHASLDTATTSSASLSRLPRLHPGGGHHLPGGLPQHLLLPIPGSSGSLRLLAANYLPRHPALRSSSSPSRYARASPEFLLNAPQKPPSSRNSSPNDRTPTKCRPAPAA